MMQRRTFLKMLALSGLAQVAPLGFVSKAEAASTPNRFWICLQADGGWDPTNFCDPKPSENNGHNWYSSTDIRTDWCSYPVAPYFATASGDAAGDAAKWENFWRNWGNKLQIINGIDQRTNGHDTGTRATWSGQQRTGLPSFGALIAGVTAPTAGMAYIGNGGFNDTRDIIGVSRLGSGDISNMQRIGNPNVPNMSNSSVTYQQSANWDLVRKSQSDRLADMAGDEYQLPQNTSNMNLLYAARNGSGSINTFLTELAKLPALTGYEVAGSSRSNLRDQAKIALAAFKSGLSVAADLRVGGFDTHSNHNLLHYPMLANMFDVMNDIMTFSQTLGIQDKINIVVGSEFGRTPGYNSDGGKDHWPYNSMLFLGADFGPNARLGNIVGSSSVKQEALAIDPVSLMPVSTGGIKIRPDHIHLQLRKLAGIYGSTWSNRYGLGANIEDIPLFSRV